MRLAILLFLAQIVPFPIPGPQPSPSPSIPSLNGAFFEFAGFTEQALPPYLDELQSIGVKRLVTNALWELRDNSGGACTKTEYVFRAPETLQLLPSLFSEAHKRGIEVWLGLTYNAVCPATPADSATAGLFAKSLTAQFGPEIHGWYIGEPYIMDDRWLPREIDSFGAMVREIRRYSPEPIAVAPYLVSWPGTPEVAASTAKAFVDGSGVNLLIYQDFIGSRYSSVTANLGWKGAIGIREYFALISAAVGRDHLCVDHEFFNARFGIDAGKGSASITRLNQQFSAVPDSVVSCRMGWINQNWLSAVSPTAYPEAARLMAGYRATHGLGGQMLTPARLGCGVGSFPTPGAIGPVAHADCGRLTDGVVGDAFDPDGAEWVELGDAPLSVDLGTARLVDWVSLHCAKLAGFGIPTEMVIYGSRDGLQWAELARRTFVTVDGFDGEWDIGNTQALAVDVRYLQINLTNAARTKASELEIVGR